MPRPLKVDRPRGIEISLPSSLFLKMELELWDISLGKVPYGAYSRLFECLVEQWLRERTNGA